MKLTGKLAIFEYPEDLVAAIKEVRALKVKKLDAFTPFPVHEVLHALGLKRSWIPWVTFVMGLAGALLLFTFQSWTSAIDWPINIGGKPLVSWPAFIPITFEGMILIGGISTVVTLILVCRLPNRSGQVLDDRLTNNRFGLFVDAEDAAFDEASLEALFKKHGAEEIKNV